MPKKAKAEAEPEAPSVESLQPLLEGMITLLGRLVYPPEKIREIVLKSKRKKGPKDYVKAYNLCDGEHTLSQIAEEIDVSIGTLSPILSGWKELGIVYEITKKGGHFYKRLYRLAQKEAETTPEEEKETVELSEPVLAKTQTVEPSNPDEGAPQPQSL